MDNIEKKPLSAPLISVVSPVYLGAELIPELVQRITQSLKPLTEDYEIILVEDGSPDCSWEAIVKATEIDSRVIGVRLSRNFGQHYAISAGLTFVRGKWTVVMDCDLQDQPEEIPKLYQKAIEGYDIVVARRVMRQDSLIRRSISLFFYRALSYLSGYNHDSSIANFGIYGIKTIQAINRMPEKIRFFPLMIRWVGFTSTEIDVVHARRLAGTSSYNFRKLLNLAIDIILANSDKPIRLAVKAGFIISAVGLIYGLVIVIEAFTGQIKVLGYASLIVSIWVLSGFLIFIIGLVGLYVGKIFDAVKDRPAFIVREVVAQAIK